MPYMFDSKSSARQIFKETDIPFPQGNENLYSKSKVYQALCELKNKTQATKTIIKLNNKPGGNGLALVDFANLGNCLVEFSANTQVIENIPNNEFTDQFEKQGAVVKEYIESPITTSPSVKMEIHSYDDIRNFTTHDQLLKNGMIYSGTQFPASEGYRALLIEYGNKIACVAAKQCARGSLSIDFLATKSQPNTDWKLYAIEINARKTAATHCYHWVRILTQSNYDVSKGSCTMGNNKLTIALLNM